MPEPAAAYLYDLLETPLPFAEAVALQVDLAAARSQSAIPDTVVLCEHPPTLSLGRSTKADQELPGGEEPYRALGWEVHRSERGGRSTWHGPGQLVCYPVLDLRAHGKDLRAYAHDLERVVIGALAELGVEARVREGREHVGVWVEDRKIASLGVSARNWIVSHGFALNVDCDVEAFGRFNACGLQGTAFTSVARELGRPVALEEARGPVVAQLEAVFGLKLEPVPVAA